MRIIKGKNQYAIIVSPAELLEIRGAIGCTSYKVRREQCLTHVRNNNVVRDLLPEEEPIASHPNLFPPIQTACDNMGEETP